MKINLRTSTNKPCDCAYCKSQRQIRNLQFRKPLDDIERQIAESRKKREEYEKTVRLLRLVNKTLNIANIKKDIDKYSDHNTMRDAKTLTNSNNYCNNYNSGNNNKFKRSNSGICKTKLQ